MSFATYSFVIKWNPAGSTVYDLLPAPDGPIQCSIRRGRASDLTTMELGTCDLVIQDKAGTYNPHNPASPLVVANQLLLMRKLQVFAERDTAYFGDAEYGTAVFGTTAIYTGYLTRLRAHPGVGVKTVEMGFVDGLMLLREAFPVIASTGPIRAAAAVDLILIHAGFPLAADKSLTLGGWLPDLRADGKRSALDIIQEIAQVDQAAFYYSASGLFTYRDRTSRYGRSRGAPVATIAAGSVEEQVPSLDIDNVVNEQHAQALAWVVNEDGSLSTENNGDLQTAVDTAYLGFKKGSSTVSSPFFRDAIQAASYASHTVTTRKKGDSPTRAVRLPGLSVGQVAQQVALDISTPVALSGIGASPEGLIEQIRHSITRSQHVTDYTLTSRPGYAFTVGVSKVGGPDLVRY